MKGDFCAQSKLDWLKDALWERRKMGKWADVREGCGERRGRREAPSKQDGYDDVIHPAGRSSSSAICTHVIEILPRQCFEIIHPT